MITIPGDDHPGQVAEAALLALRSGRTGSTPIWSAAKCSIPLPDKPLPVSTITAPGRLAWKMVGEITETFRSAK